MKNFGVKTFVVPQPVLIVASYDKDNKPNAMNAAWGGIIEADQICISFSQHQTTDNIDLKNAFTVSIGTKEYKDACDYVGMVSGKEEPKKMEKAGFSTRKSEFVDAPVINELPLTLECELLRIDGVRENGENHYIGKIVNVCADDSILTDGEIDYSKFHPIVYDPCNHGYYELGEKVGQAFKDGLKLK